MLNVLRPFNAHSDCFECPLTVAMCDVTMKWHLATVEQKQSRLTRHNLLKMLRKQHDVSKTVLHEVQAFLPCLCVQIKISWLPRCHANDRTFYTACCPHIQVEDLFWHNGDPFSPPPDDWLELRDINDGQAHRKTHDEPFWPGWCHCPHQSAWAAVV